MSPSSNPPGNDTSTPSSKPNTGGSQWALIAVTVIGALTFLASIGVIVWLVTYEDGGEVSEGSFLRVNLSGALSDAPAQGGLVLDPADIPPTTTEMALAIQQAATDERITGLYLTLGNLGGGWGSLQELRGAIGQFEEAGKPCVVYAETLTTGSYYLASACDQIILAPAGLSMVTGLQSSVTYYAGTLEKLGISAEFEHVGDFKSGPEPFMQDGPSESASQAMEFLLDGLYDEMVAGIAQGRDMSPDDVRARIDSPSLSAQAALEAGLVDALAFQDVVVARAHASGEEGWLSSLQSPVTETERESIPSRYTRLSEYLKGVRAEQRSQSQHVAVIAAEGAIMSGPAGGGLFGSAGLTDQSFRSWMKAARKDDSVGAVVVRVNSPGGSGLASDMMWREVLLTQEAGKPVVISMGDYAASGGYYISAPADWVVAQPSTITGSIGVFGGKMNLSGMYEKVGMTSHSWKRGEESDMFSGDSGFSENGRAAYRRFLSDFYEVFLAKVGEGRDMERDAVHAVAQGRVWTGRQALEHGLVDEIGGLDVALRKAEELAGLGEAGVKHFPERKDFMQLLLEDLESGGTVKVDLGLGPIGTEAVTDVLVLDHILKDGAAALLPGRLTIH